MLQADRQKHDAAEAAERAHAEEGERAAAERQAERQREADYQREISAKVGALILCSCPHRGCGAVLVLWMLISPVDIATCSSLFCGKVRHDPDVAVQ